MGDPHSPGMTIGTCAWMEHEWLQSINGDSQSNFKARRYMDDLLVFYARNDSWDEARFLQDIGGHCYLPPLKLEDGTAGTFLETSFEITGNTIRHWLKNENVTGEPPKIWRYSHFDSHGQFSQKKATLMACLTKVQKMASDGHSAASLADALICHRPYTGTMVPSILASAHDAGELGFIL